MNKMTDMKMSKAQKKKLNMPSRVSSDGQDYPWGLQINLDDSAIKKLGIIELPDAETECQVMAVGKITRVSSTSENGTMKRSMEIQIMKMNVECKEDDEKSKSQIRAAYKKVSG